MGVCSFMSLAQTVMPAGGRIPGGHRRFRQTSGRTSTHQYFFRGCSGQKLSPIPQSIVVALLGRGKALEAGQTTLRAGFPPGSGANEGNQARDSQKTPASARETIGGLKKLNLGQTPGCIGPGLAPKFSIYSSTLAAYKAGG